MMRQWIAAAMLVGGWATFVQAQPETIFYDSFEPPTNMSNWEPWQDLSPNPDPCLSWPQPCGPNALWQEANHAHEGDNAARQEEAQPGWWASTHDMTEDALWVDYDPESEVLRVSAWQFEDANDLQPLGFGNHDQVQGWLSVMSLVEDEFAAIGVHAHRSLPLDTYLYISWKTSANGWNLTTVPRVQGHRLLTIEIYPYSGFPGDIKFYVDGQMVGEGDRQPGSGDGIAFTRLGLGANAFHIPEDSLGNTYEFFWYDEVEVQTDVPTVSPCVNPDIRFDADNDGDVDHEDFAKFQMCHTGPIAPGSPKAYTADCRCMNTDGDSDIDEDDYPHFEACASGPGVDAATGCDDGLAYP